ncbi:MAG TPA: alpha/beta hydrolase-fold protein [Gemmatimonadaceae bacterium]|nr:alpha/beta hydrolase-fold protein [Gemmatimonadaceae bacterium]
MKLRALLFLAVLSAPVAGQDGTFTLWTRELIHSAKLNEDRSILVSTPNGYDSGTDRFPVLVILDASDLPQFRLAIANVEFLASRGLIPQMIVVGIPNGKDRTHDLTPSATGSTAREYPSAGGATTFADFLIDEVIPLVRSKYRTLPGTVLAGHSFGGLVALEVATKRPGAFTGVIAMSPSLWWNDSSLVATYYDALAKSAKPQRLFMTSGGYEDDIDRPTTRLALRLDSLKSAMIAFAHRRYPEDSHGLTPAPSLADGLRFVFDPIAISKLPISVLNPSVDSAGFVRAVNESIQQYATSARTVGADERLPEAQLNDLSYGIVHVLKKPGLAIWVVRKNAELYPQSPMVYDCLGDALLASGDTTAAMAQFRRAITLGTPKGHPVVPESTRKLKELEARKRDDR